MPKRMTEEEWKAFEKHLEDIVDPQPDQTKFYHSVLLAHKELQAWREAEKYLVRNLGVISYGYDGVFVQTFIGGRVNKEVQAPTLIEAVEKARGE